jgi:hypothetical protein
MGGLMSKPDDEKQQGGKGKKSTRGTKGKGTKGKGTKGKGKGKKK